MEERVAVLETHIEHIRSDVAYLKVDIRDMRREMAEGFGTVNGRIDKGFAETAALRESINSAKFWALGLYAALTVGIFSVMARGFGWV